MKRKITRRQLPESSKYSRDEINNDDDVNTNIYYIHTHKHEH